MKGGLQRRAARGLCGEMYDKSGRDAALAQEPEIRARLARDQAAQHVPLTSRESMSMPALTLRAS